MLLAEYFREWKIGEILHNQVAVKDSVCSRGMDARLYLDTVLAKSRPDVFDFVFHGLAHHPIPVPKMIEKCG